MKRRKTNQLISYIPPAAPARRRWAEGDEAFLRPEIGFTPNWYREKLQIDFGRRWHTEPGYRRETVIAMREELRRRFGGTRIGGIDRPDKPLDLLTGTLGIAPVVAIYGLEIIFAEDKWPDCEQRFLSDDEVDKLRPPDLDTNPTFQNIMEQTDWIYAKEGSVEGFVNWQGVLNNAYRLRGEQLFIDMMTNQERCRHLFDCICTTMIEAAKRLHARQRASGFEVGFFTVSNCLVNMVSPEQYRGLLFAFDKRIAQEFGCIAIHNCAWNADPYVEDYARVPNPGYIDMGLESNLVRARELFADARRAVMYTPMELAEKPVEVIRQDLERIAREYAPCDIVAGDIEAGTSDERILAFVEMCDEISSGR